LLNAIGLPSTEAAKTLPDKVQAVLMVNEGPSGANGERKNCSV
jgi:hypothetical protein